MQKCVKSNHKFQFSAHRLWRPHIIPDRIMLLRKGWSKAHRPNIHMILRVIYLCILASPSPRPLSRSYLTEFSLNSNKQETPSSRKKGHWRICVDLHTAHTRRQRRPCQNRDEEPKLIILFYFVYSFYPTTIDRTLIARIKIAALLWAWLNSTP